MLIDTHAHLTDEKFEGEVENIISAFPQFNIESVVTVGCDMPSSQKSVELANKFERVFATVGIHPHDSENVVAKDYQVLEKLAQNSKVLAYGEIGLDYFYDFSPRERQQKVFQEQLELADSLNLPVVLHIRDAYEDAKKILFDNKNKLKNGLVLHCYSGSLEMAQIYSKLDGVFYSFGGSLTFKNAKQNASVLKWLPDDRFMLETDCPYLTPTPFRGKRNEPKMLEYVVNKIAEIREISAKEVENLANKTAKAFFKNLPNIPF